MPWISSSGGPVAADAVADPEPVDFEELVVIPGR